jgi:hypothetical protein
LNDQEALDRATKAKALLDDPDLQSAFDDVRQAIFKAIEGCPLRDQEGLHEYRLMLKLLNDLRANLEQRVRDGKIVAFRLKEEKPSFLGEKRWKILGNNP